MTLAVIELDPDSVVPEHSHENEQLGVLVSGLLEFRVGDETRRVGPGGTWSIPANVPHEVQAGPEGAVAVEVFAPTRDGLGGARAARGASALAGGRVDRHARAGR